MARDLAVMLGDQIAQASLEVVTKSTLVLIGPAEVTTKKSDGKLLKQFRRDVLVPDRSDEVTVRGSTISFDENCPSPAVGFVGLLPRFSEQSPSCRDSTKPVVRV